MSAPNAIPPARLDARLEAIYDTLDSISVPTSLHSEVPPPVLALCGGATDNLIPSETCTLLPLPPTQLNSTSSHSYRKTVFTTSLRGAWTGVGHQAMVWCDQVRARVARAGIELGAVTSSDEGVKVLEKWFGDSGSSDEDVELDRNLDLSTTRYTLVARDERLSAPLAHSAGSPHAYLLPIPRPSSSSSPSSLSRLTILLARGTLAGSSPYVYQTSPLRVSLFHCRTLTDPCTPISRLDTKAKVEVIPLPKVGEQWPLPDEGVKDGEGVVVWEGEFESVREWRDGEADVEGWVAVKVDGEADGAWIVGGFGEDKDVTLKDGKYGQSSPFYINVTS